MASTKSMIERLIVRGYDNLNMSIEDLVQEHQGELSVIEIKLILYSGSSKFRDALKAEGGDKALEALEDDEERILRNAIKDLALNAEDDAIRLGSLKYLHQHVVDKKKDKLNLAAIKTIGVDIATFNRSIMAAKMQQLNQVADALTIDI